jgi:hypothetical protein
VGTDAGRDCLQWKLVGNLFHGHVLVLHLVMPHITDDSNLVCHCLDTSLEALVQVRTSKGQPSFLPPNMRIQLDGVSSNWGSTVFAHVANMQHKRIIGHNADVVRNPVGSTHEDIDALFGTAKEELIKTDCVTPSQMMATIKKAFASYQLPVVLQYVDAVFDYAGYYAPHLDKSLSGYG